MAHTITFKFETQVGDNNHFSQESTFEIITWQRKQPKEHEISSQEQQFLNWQS